LAELSQVIFDAFTPLKPFVALARGVFKVLAQGIKSLVTALKPLTHAMQQVTNIINSIFGGGGSGSFGSKIEDLEGALQTVRDAMQDLKFSDMNPADSITQLKDATKEYDKLRQAAFGDNATQEDIGKFSDFAKTYLGLSKEVNKSSSAYTEDFERVAGDLEGLETKLGDSLAGINEDPMGFGGFVDMLWEWLEGLLEKIVQAVVEAFQKLLNGAMSLLKWLYNTVVGVLTKAFDGAINLLGQLVSIVVGVLQKAFTGTINFFSYLVTVVRDVLQRGFSGYVNFLQELYGAVWEKIKEGFQGYINFLEAFYQAVWDKLKEGLEGYWNFLKDFYTTIWDKLVEGFTGYINWLSDFYTMVWNVIKNGFSGYISWLSSFYSMIWDIVVKGFTGYVNWLTSMYTMVFNVLQSGFSGSISFLEKIAEEIGKVIERGLAGTVSFFSTVVEKVGKFIESGFKGTFDFVGVVKDKIIGLLTGGTSILQTIIDKILSALGLKGFKQTIPILPNPFKSFLGGPTNFLELDFAFAKGGQVPSYATGGMAVGPSHQSGMLGMTKKGTPFLFEGDEFILNKKSSKVLGPQLLNALNQVGTSREAMGAMSGILNAYQLTTMASGGNVGSNFNVALRSNGLGDMNLLYLNNPLRDYAGPNHWYVKASPDLKKGSLGLTRNIFASGGSLLDLQKQTMNPLAPFGSNARFGVSGNLSGNSWSKDLINISNPLTYFVSEIVDWVKKWTSIFNWFLDPVYESVEKVLGPDRLKLGVKSNMLDFWNTSLSANFGGDVLNKLGFGSLPTPSNPSISFSNGGLVTGPSHAMGGRMAELEGGEFVINRRAAQAYGYANLASINNGGSDAILQKITQALGDLTKPQIEVHVYTDMRGEARAEISKFRYEVRQKAERSRINPTEKIVPLSAI
jgi:phage-related protein